MENRNENVVDIQNVSHGFGENTVLHEIELQIKEGEIFGLLGPSGAGKTTLIKILTGQLAQKSGKAVFLGEDTKHLSSQAYKKMGIMLDNLGLYERLSCYDNLKVFADIYGVKKDAIEAALEGVGLYEAKKRAVKDISKGMRQRLMFARAVLHNPKVIFLDEPTSGLDPGVMQEIHKLIEKQKEAGTTIFLTTHNMEEAEKLCGRVALLYEGKIVECGSPKAVCAKYDHQRQIGIMLESGESVVLQNGPEAAEKMKELLLKERIAEIHSTEPNLEKVFLELTGADLDR
ncbi:MAG: ABC transporter ATP-binding protein [Lachnospiraceae bacterium]|nr:ABC transporter ATP-binding protein [Lachnospiraceae bacterium]